MVMSARYSGSCNHEISPPWQDQGGPSIFQALRPEHVAEVIGRRGAAFRCSKVSVSLHERLFCSLNPIRVYLFEIFPPGR